LWRQQHEGHFWNQWCRQGFYHEFRLWWSVWSQLTIPWLGDLVLHVVLQCRNKDSESEGHSGQRGNLYTGHRGKLRHQRAEWDTTNQPCGFPESATRICLDCLGTRYGTCI
jgi:hypothetical protein